MSNWNWHLPGQVDQNPPSLSGIQYLHIVDHEVPLKNSEQAYNFIAKRRNNSMMKAMNMDKKRNLLRHVDAKKNRLKHKRKFWCNI